MGERKVDYASEECLCGRHADDVSLKKKKNIKLEKATINQKSRVEH